MGSIGGATLASRILGFVRDMVVAQAFGAGPVTDAFFVAFRIPNILRRLLAEGALSTAVIPVFTDYAMTRSARRAAPDAAGGAGRGAARAGPSRARSGSWRAPWILTVIAPGFAADPGQFGLAVTLTRVHVSRTCSWSGSPPSPWAC